MKKSTLLAVVMLAAVTLARGADISENWEKDCRKCHGPDGKGDTKMGKKYEVKDYTDAAVQAAMKDEDMVKAIKEGIKDKEGKDRMKAYGETLTADQVKALVAYVRAFKK
jgi:cytochrome c6